MKLLSRIALLLFGMLVLAALVWGGFLYFAEYRAAAALDRLSVLLAPQAKFRYGAIAARPLKGELQVDNLQFEWPVLGSLYVRQATLQRLQPDFYLSPMDAFNGNSLPPVMALQLQGVGLPLPEQSLSREQACSLSGLMRLAGMQRQGLQRLGGEGRLSYEFDRVGAGALFHLTLRLEQLGDLALDLELRKFHPDQLPFALPVPGDSQMRLRVLPELPRRQLAYCAGGEPPLAYLNRLLERPDSELGKNLGWIPGSGIRSILATMLGRGGTLELRTKPVEALDLDTLRRSGLDRLPHLLGITANLDDQAISDLSLEAWSTADGARQVSEPRPVPQQPPASPKYRVTEISRLSHYIGFRVRLSVGEGVPLREGVLASVSEGRAVLEQRIQGGLFSIFVPLRSVQQAEVLRSR